MCLMCAKAEFTKKWNLQKVFKEVKTTKICAKIKISKKVKTAIWYTKSIICKEVKSAKICAKTRICKKENSAKMCAKFWYDAENCRVIYNPRFLL